jgi:hypothetical protein
MTDIPYSITSSAVTSNGCGNAQSRRSRGGVMAADGAASQKLRKTLQSARIWKSGTATRPILLDSDTDFF